MAAFSNLQERVRRRIIDAPVSVDVEVPLLVKGVIKEMQDKHNFAVMKRTYSSPTVVSDEHDFASIPANFKAYRSRPFYTTNYGNEVPMRIIPEVKVSRATFGSKSIGAPQALTETVFEDATNPDGWTRAWRIYPIPDGLSDFDDGEYRISVPYWGYDKELIGGNDTNWFTLHCNEYIVFQATAKAFELDWDLDHAAQWAARSANAWKVIRDADILEQMSAQDTLAVTGFAGDDADYRGS